MRIGKIIGMLISVLLLLNTTLTLSNDLVTFNSTEISIELSENLVQSNKIAISIVNSPELPDEVHYQLIFDDLFNYNFTDSKTVEFSQNLVANGRVIELKVSSPTDEVSLAVREVPSAIWNHVKHIFVNWTFGDNPPADGRGFGQGAVYDSDILSSLVDSQIATQNDLVTLAEDVFNLLFGSSDDFNNDGSVNMLSDGYGLFNYSIGMRDHIRNAGNADEDQQSELVSNKNAIVTAFADIVDEGDASLVFDNLNTSDTLFGKIYQTITRINEELADNNLDLLEMALKSNSTQLSTFLRDTFEDFRSLVFDTDFAITDGEVSLIGPESNEDDSPIHFEIILLSTITIAIVIKKINFKENKL